MFTVAQLRRGIPSEICSHFEFPINNKEKLKTRISLVCEETRCCAALIDYLQVVKYCQSI